MTKEKVASGAWVQIVSCTQMHSQLFRTVAILFACLVSILRGVSQCPFLLSYLLLREAVQLCHVFTSFLLGLFLSTRDEALFAAHLLFLEVSKEERLWREGGMHHLKGWCGLCISCLH